ncbi:hemicentin-1 [Chiloscyllium plagiosum]|uniref:hemicentin-1 n=1 Tax=Chiloscyllium plagiosum TaxID=36176 RepID=UPI001CB7C3D8|nr:hemicentin-1 [Chiloscyllium plagiosum]
MTVPMNFKWLFKICTACLVLLSQSTAQDAPSRASEGRAEDIPEGASTLAFVFDVTGSMYDDLVQVIEGASKILETSLSRPKKPLHNFALVPFHDPEVGPVTITTDPKKFQYELRELYVQGGGDCPEMSIAAIKIALEISLPGSFIYVFTDARSKDYRLTHDVLQLIQQKQSQVVFVLTGDCGDRSHVGYKVYEEIASTSSGQVFHLDKKQVNEVLKWVKEAVQASKVHLLSTDHGAQAINIWKIPFDPSLKEVTVSLSGPAPSIEIRDPTGKLIKKGSGLNELLHITNSARVVNVKDPEPGLWTIKTTSGGRHSVRVTGLSAIDFRAGFARKPTMNFKKIGNRPVQGIPTYLLLNTTGLIPPARVDQVELLGISGITLKTIPLKYYPDRKPYSILNVTEFIPPDEAFFLKITGYDTEGYLFQRVSGVSYSNIVPGPPKVVMPAQTPGYYLQTGFIICNVDSLIPFTLRFSRAGTKLGTDQFFKESATAHLEIPQVSAVHEGFYECIAVSSAGTGRAQTFLDVSEPPPTIQVPNNVTVIPSERAILTCLTLSTVRYNLTWQKNGADRRLAERHRVQVMRNLSLEIKNVRPSDAGQYNCIAANEGGATLASVFLIVQEPPKVTVYPKNQTFTERKEVRISCSVTGYPQPHVVWTHNDMFIMGASRHMLSKGGSLIIRHASQKDSGVYTCLASNPAGTDREASVLTYIEAPKVTVVRKEILIGLGDTSVLECKTTGIPEPEVKWFKGDLELSPSNFLSIDSHQGILKIQGTQDLDAGDYTCVAENDAGRASGQVTLDVGSSPVFSQTPLDISADIGSNLTLPCQAQGYPKPRIRWQRLDRESLFSRHTGISSVTQLRTGSLFFHNLWVDDEGTYSCEAENQFGKIQAEVTVTVTGLVTPLIGISPAVVNIIEGQALTLPCVLLAGNPLPERRWIKNNFKVTTDGYVTIRRDGSLHIERIRLRDSGKYTCLASNVAGTKNRTTTVNIFVLPTIQHGPQVFSTIEGVSVKLPCKAHGVPKPSIVWSKNGELISQHLGKISTEPDGGLLISSPTGKETGEFVCTATNAAGYASRKVQLTVYVKPRIITESKGSERGSPKEVSVIEGEDVTLSCEVQSFPPPIINWAKNMQLISPFSPRHTQLSSGLMKIIETRLSDSGLYLCIATNIAGNVTQYTKLTVNVPPRIQPGPRVIKVQAGHRVDIPCNAWGVPKPTITWYRGSNNIWPDNKQYNVDAEGTLTIEKVQITDEGVYSCVVKNVAGQHEVNTTVQVHEPPTVEDPGPPYNNPFQERVANQRIAFPCPAKGIPKPVIKWLRNGRELTGTEPDVSILDDGTLLIDTVSPHDNGEYVCVAVNEAGTSERKYQLKVHVPPEIRENETPANISVVTNQPFSLFCDVSGHPIPIITWYKDGVSIGNRSIVQVLNAGKTLKVHKAATGDTGRYTCQTINIAGTAEKIFNVEVLVPPSIMDAGKPNEVSVILNRETILECKVKGIPFPNIQWYKDNRLLFPGDTSMEIKNKGQVLHIKSVQLSDQGHYQCSAVNAAGKRFKEFKLNVYVPPSIKGGNITTDLTVLLNHPMTLECEARGIPLPAITWYKADRPIISSPHATYINRGQLLQISQAHVSDAGQYICRVTSISGIAERYYVLDVYVPPHIEGGGPNGPLHKKVSASSSVVLQCEASGYPSPVLTWLKDGVPVKPSDNTRVLQGGRKLEILNAAVPNAGGYVCVASSISGESKIEYTVDVLVPPNIEGNDATDTTVVIQNPLKLKCDATGNPPPNIMWLKDGQPIKTMAGVQILANGQKLIISQTQVSDTGRYQCVATNEAGSQRREFNVIVQVSPTIRSTGPSERTVVVHKTINLQCVANGIPYPAITWLKDGRPINTAGGNIKLESAGRMLQIVNALLEDAGQYSCVATNSAGEAQQHIRLYVHEPPSIEDGGLTLNETVIVRNPVELKCKASGNPIPAVTWYKDNQPISISMAASILNRGQLLQIASAQVADRGMYKCAAVNLAGSAEIFYDLKVYVPPTIIGSNDMVTVVVNNPVRLECEASGIPVPSLTWLKDGSPVSSFSDAIQVQSRGRVLSITSAQISDTGKYTCVALNAAGEQQQHIDLRVHVPPNIMGEEQNASVIINQGIVLKCQSNAIPPPTLSWLKDGKPLLKKQGLTVSDDGSTLKIEAAQVLDAGRYTCEATNVAGKTEKNYNLNVWVPPSIQGLNELSKLTVIEGSLISLICESSGIPPPSLMWMKNGSPLLNDHIGQVRIVSGGRQLQISNAKISDGASYTCVASNIAGNSIKEYTLEVYVRPTISNSGSHLNEVSVIRGNDITLECKTQGIPRPALTWMKDGRPLVNSRRVSILNDGQLLRVQNTQIFDAGRYVCVAESVAGQVDKRYNLNVHVPPSINGAQGVPENISVVVNNPVVLACEASGIPLPSITWLKNGQPISLNSAFRILSGGWILRLMHPAVEDSGRYSCVVTNAAGEDSKNFNLNVLVPPSIVNEDKIEDLKIKEKQSITFTCEASGNPVPQIKWMKDGQPLTEDQQHQILSSGRFLQIERAHVSDAGRYTCIASNTAGDKNKNFNLHVLVSPKIPGVDAQGTPEDIIVVLNSPTSLVCEAQSYPPATITWLKDGAPFDSNKNVQILPGGRTLQILNAKEKDAGRYTCIATNEAGETLKHYEVKVYIPPTINKDDVPGFGLSPKEIKIKVNSSLTLQCESHAIPAATLHWYKDGQPLKKDDHITITANGHIIQIKNAQLSDTGRYTCVATNVAGEDEKDYDVNVQVPPSFVKPVHVRDTKGSALEGSRSVDFKDVVMNNPISLYCETNAVPPPSLTWYKDRKLLTSNDKVLILPGGRVLQIPRAQIEDAGRYTCVATNEAGEDSIQYELRVMTPPTIKGADSDLPEEVIVLINKTTMLDCMVSGTPNPKITWLKDGQPLKADNTHKILSNGRTLQILSAHVSDTGRYVCVAENVAGNTEKYFNLNVHVPPIIMGTSPENMTVVINNFISLMCEATAFPPPSLSWLKDGKPLQSNTNVIILPGGRTVQLPRAKQSDGGKYACLAMNQAGEAEKQIYLTVYVPPTIKDRAGDSPQVISIRTGNTVTLECESNAVPPPVITWFKNGRPITESNNIRTLANGQRLEITGAEVSDTGQYVCKAINIAGQVDKNFHLNVHVPPSIEGLAEEKISEIISNPVTFACDATGIPPPTLTWLKNGRTFANAESLEMHILSGGNKLQIARSQLSDSGTYTCVASNVEGTARKNYILTIQIPPNIFGAEMPSDVSVLVGENVKLICAADGNPRPSIQWLKDGKPLTADDDERLRVSPDGSAFHINGTVTTDIGKYTCVATNSAGEEDRIFNLNVYVPPTIYSDLNGNQEVTTILDNSVNIECMASGSPPPQLNWLKNGLPLPISSQIRLLSAGKVLRIVRTQVSDAGTYTCVASNRAGVDNKHYNLIVYVPPRLDDAGSTEELTVIKGNSASLTCITDGTPTPTLAWLKEALPLKLGPHMTVRNQGMLLQISMTDVKDTGRYTCVAANEAGEVNKHFNLKVLDPPRINNSNFTEEASVVVNNPLELHCVASGIPTPTLTWIKDGRPLPHTDSVHILRGGQVLRILNAQVQDTGRYTCLASSTAGDDDREYLVRVHVPPNIAGQSGPQVLAVLRNGQVILECKSDAVPPPTLTWLKDGKPLQATPRLRILSSGRYLQINNVELADSAQYTCVASNVAGNMTREFTLAVNVAPTIKEGSQTVIVHRNQLAVLKCVVDGVPTPQVTWRKDGTILSTSNLRYSFLGDGSLRIGSTQVTDTGRYLCMATNAAGTARKRIDVQVYVPPSIAADLNNNTVLVNVQTTLTCEATGIPKPTVSWKKNGRILNTDQNQNMYRLLSSGSLVIISPTVEDSGNYECKVSNYAGEDQRFVRLTVQVPPSIADEATDLLVTKLSPAVITCTASGVPAPKIHWTKDGVKLPRQGEGYLILSTGTIDISTAQLSHTGKYTCVAKNAAGTAHRQVNLRVQELPVIQTQPSKLDVILNNSIILPCEATGTPTPTITWQKEGISINTEGGDYTVLPNGSLQITQAAIKDTGTYICVAQNPTGTALGKIKLRVQVPPVIMAHPKNYIVALDKSVTMLCEAKGYPMPEVTWNKDGQPVTESIRQRILSTGALQIAFVQPRDTGRYTCTASNLAGSRSSVMVLTVHIPPTIHTTDIEYTVVKESQATLPCIADGVPEPVITWKKDGKVLHNIPRKYRLMLSGELIVENTMPDDTGNYTCVATNMAGQDTKTFSLTVYVHPAFTELPGDASLNKGERLSLNCAANGIPTPKIIWTFNNSIKSAQYNNASGQSKLVIEKVSKDDSGTYVCTAENKVGSIKAIGSVYVKEPPIFGDFNPNRIEPLGGNAILNCEVRGDPPPTIQWSKKGIHIQITNRIRQLHNGSLAIYGTVNEDAGDYKCIATNDAGVVERSVTLTLQSSPVFTVEPMDTVIDAGAIVMLNCQAVGEPLPTVEWSRQGQPLIENERIAILSNNSLRLTAVKKEDTSEYECVTRNLMGSALVKITLTVQVHGGFSEWLQWDPCSVTCGQGMQKRLRLCNNPMPANGGRHCEGTDSETRRCQSKPCPVDGSWSEWSQWEECSRTCGQGNRTRTRTCTNPPVQYGGKRCDGNAVEAIMCNIRPCPVVGGWGSWLPWGPCSETCGKGIQTRLRLCNNPPPSFDGANCEGQDAQTRVCKNRLCPVDGKWTSWVSWTACSVSCGGGTRQRARTCSDPVPQYGGHYCEGSDVQIDFCNSDPCPIHGNWGPWSSWGTCSRTCNGGQMRRYRTCDNPHPTSGGRACAGADTQIHRCSIDICPVNGNWGPWQAWNDCSVSCGGGEKRRLRMCNNPVPSNGGRSCPGDGSQVSRCKVQPCPGGPQHARGSIIGNINNVEFGVALLNATVFASPETGTHIIQAQISNVPRSIGPAMRKLISILNPIYWTTAKEIGEAVNGYSLTEGIFKRETQVEFATGEILRMTHIARGLDSDGALLLDIVVNGYVLQLPSSVNLNVKDYTEDYIQIGPGQIYAHSTRMFTVDDASVPYSWNHTITYGHNRGRMPFLVETLHATAIAAEYSPLEEILEYKIHAIITKGDRSNQCPNGFVLDSVGPYCSDEDECAIRNPCSHICHNAMGTYYCSCPKGLTISADGRTCQDVDECALGGHTCHTGQDCENTVGSYQCVVRCGIGFRRTLEGLSCQDINECQETHPCQHRCLNAIGSFRCVCNRGYQLRGRRCLDINECRQSVCQPDQQCKNTKGGFRCIDLCPSGMTKAENGSCVDINECKDGTHQCRYNQICENTQGSYRCVCPRGYRSQGVGRPCIDIDECERVPKPCAYQCINTPGSFKCLCPPGQHLLGDGKSCAGLERLPNYERIYNFAQFPNGGYHNQQQPRHQQQFSQSSKYRSHTGYRSIYRAAFSRTGRSIRETCPQGYEAKNNNCIDINECENKEPCQHDCKNTPGSYQCLCPSGYRLMPNGKACHDIDECLEQNIHCGANHMCFNMRGSYQCIDTPCPPKYQRDPVTGFCLKDCPPNDLECALSPYALEYKLVALPFGISANQDLIRLVAYTHDGVMHPRTIFYMVDEDPLIPFAIRDENLKGVVFTIRPLREPQTYRMKVRASSYSVDGTIEYQTTFIVYIAVSAYPY